VNTIARPVPSSAQAVQEDAVVAAPPRAADGAPAQVSGVLLLDGNPRVQDWFQMNFGGTYPIVGATTIAEAAQTLARLQIGVIVAAEAVGGASTLPLLRIAKREQPLAMAVVLGSSQDSALVLQLINEVKVCRVLFKPIKAGAVELALRAAMRLHETQRAAGGPMRAAPLAAATPLPESIGASIGARPRASSWWSRLVSPAN